MEGRHMVFRVRSPDLRPLAQFLILGGIHPSTEAFCVFCTKNCNRRTTQKPGGTRIAARKCLCYSGRRSKMWTAPLAR